jgi:hypothetical protein
MLKILFIGDIVGRLGRQAVIEILPELKKELAPDFVIANVENIAHGTGVTAQTLAQIETAGLDAFTSGNHIWSKKEAEKLLVEKPNLLRPHNYRGEHPGRGLAVFTTAQGKLAVINLLGRVFMRDSEQLACPFKELEKLLAARAEQAKFILVDLHAEATSEKVAFGFFADGKVSAVLGTHTHVPTADQKILPLGTGFISDVGMVGAVDSVIGANKKTVINRFLAEQTEETENLHDLPETGQAVFNAVLLTFKPDGSCQEIQRIDKSIKIG